MSPRPFVDAHVHFWDPDKLQYDWLKEEPGLFRSFLPSDLRSAARNVSLQKAVFVQADCRPNQGLDEVEWVSSLAERHDWIGGIVAFAPVELGDRCEAGLERLEGWGRVRGIRRLIQSEGPEFANQPDFVKGVQSVGRKGWPFDLCLKHHQMRDVIRLVRLCPDTRFVLDHMGKPDIAGGVLDPWQTDVATLAGLPNVVCKISGLVTEADRHHWNADQLRPYLDVVLQAFGPGRLLFGSDWPVATLAATYEDWVRLVQDWSANWSDEEKRRFFVSNAQDTYAV